MFPPSSRIALVYQSVCSRTIADQLLYDWITEKKVCSRSQKNVNEHNNNNNNNSWTARRADGGKNAHLQGHGPNTTHVYARDSKNIIKLGSVKILLRNMVRIVPSAFGPPSSITFFFFHPADPRGIT